MKLLQALLLFLPFTLLEVGCEGTNPNQSTLDANGQPVSSVPWNKPESWEQNGQLGTAMGSH